MSFDLRLGDCLAPDAMASLGVGGCDVVITDPPYSAHVHAKHRVAQKQDNDLPAATRIRSGETKRRISESKAIEFEHITQDVMESVADRCALVARRWVLVFCDVESSHLWAGALRSAGLQYVRTMAWQKLGGTPQFTGDRPGTAFEAIVVAHPPGKKRWNGGGKAGWYAVPTAMDRDGSGLDERMHTTQKPVALMEALIRDFTNPGELICDPFAGSGTTLLAATRLGRRSIGWEKDADTHAKALRRLQGEKQLPDGFIEETQGRLAL